MSPSPARMETRAAGGDGGGMHVVNKSDVDKTRPQPTKLLLLVVGVTAFLVYGSRAGNVLMLNSLAQELEFTGAERAVLLSSYY